MHDFISKAANDFQARFCVAMQLTFTFKYMYIHLLYTNYGL